MTPTSPVRINPEHVRKDPEGRCKIIKGSGSKLELTAFDKRFTENRERSEQFQAKMEVTPLGSSHLLVDD